MKIKKLSKESYQSGPAGCPTYEKPNVSHFIARTLSPAKRNFFYFIKVLLAISFSLFSFTLVEGEKNPPSASNFSLKDLNGKKVELKELLLKGPVLISFWATHCKPCVEELNKLQKVYMDYKDKGFTILAIDEDGPRSVSKVKSFVAGLKWSFPVLLDKEKEVYRLYKVLGIPHTVLIDKQGKIRYTHTTYKPGDDKIIRDKIIALMEEKEGEDEK